MNITKINQMNFGKDKSDEFWWCNTHQRRATYIFKNKHCCAPYLGGIMIPCDCVNLTGILEIDETNSS